jgi:flagellar motility protein MotE (MotC chaperone)
MDPEYVAAEQLHDQLNQRETELEERESKVAKEKERLAELEKKLDDREKELDRKEWESVPIYRRPMTDEELEDMKSIGEIYARMQPADAAAILASLYSIDDMAAILYYMSEESSSAILAAMDRTVAAEITDELLHD